MSHLFEPFHTTKEPGSGSGLGLPSVWGIVTQNGGEIEVHSEPGSGTRLEVYLPVTDRPVEPLAKPETRVATAVPSAILLVEDDKSLRAVMREVLERNGHRVVAVGDGAAAVATVRSEPGGFDLVICDVVMPGMAVKEAMDAIMGGRPGLRAIYMSGYPDRSAREEGLLNDSVVFLQKPFTPDKLLAVVGTVLGNDVKA